MTEDGQLDMDIVLSGDTNSPQTDKPNESPPSRTRANALPTLSIPGGPDESAMPKEVDETGEPTADSEPIPALAGPRSQQIFYLTNRMNLNGILSSRMIAPRESFEKYYTDLLNLCPGWVPLLSGPPPADLIEHVMSERGAGAPVLIELLDSALKDAGLLDAVTYVPAVTLSDVKAIHFRDKRALREHRARAYTNVHPHDELLQISPALFESEARGHVHIAAPEGEISTDWNRVDRVRGAVSGIVAAVNCGEALSLAAGVLGADRPTGEETLPPWLGWPALIGADIESPSETTDERADRLMFQAAYRTLGLQDQTQSWSPTTVLDTIRGKLATADLDGATLAIVDRNLVYIRKLIDAEREFEPFRPSSPYVAAKSLLMVLLRPDLEQLLAWSEDETGADTTTRSVAALLAGCLRGMARESTTSRSVALDDRTAAWAVEVASGEEGGTLGKAEFLVDPSKTVLMLDGAEVFSSSPLVPRPEVLYQEIAPDARLAARIGISRRFGWPVTVRIPLPANAEVSQDESCVSVTSAEPVVAETVVDEPMFLDRLRSLTGRDRLRANDGLTRATGSAVRTGKDCAW